MIVGQQGCWQELALLNAVLVPSGGVETPAVLWARGNLAVIIPGRLKMGSQLPVLWAVILPDVQKYLHGLYVEKAWVGMGSESQGSSTPVPVCGAQPRRGSHQAACVSVRAVPTSRREVVIAL